MLFNSYHFIAAFLPATIFAVWLAERLFSRTAALAVVTLASLFFYAWWSPPHVLLLLLSITGNFLLAGSIRRFSRKGRDNSARALMIVGVVANLAVIAYYKYADFFISDIAGLAGLDFAMGAVVLPLGISFFTFQQIAYVIDSYRSKLADHDFLDYALFISFFPQLIAGPIVYHGEMLPQLRGGAAFRFSASDLGIGLKLFVMGLFKKVVLADGMAVYATPGFEAVETGAVLSLIEAWSAALAYTLQLYFDFSGYSDMAIGLGCMFGLRLPLNFNSPYKATSIIEFWRRWHMTLSRFLREFLYIPLGGGRHGPTRRWLNLLITMLLGGLWHGAGWTFVAWGGLHGGYLCINHGWRFGRGFLFGGLPVHPIERFAGFVVTFIAVVIAWVFFRAESFAGALTMLEGMAGMHGVILPDVWAIRLAPLMPIFTSMGVTAGPTPLFEGTLEIVSIAGLLLLAFLAPSSQQWIGWQFHPNEKRQRGVPGAFRAILFGLLAGYVAIHLYVGGYSEFLYFQF
jgi:D-alanyl-lipoteichoic acid acyltransferase DltB (MBOAT superfamily)